MDEKLFVIKENDFTCTICLDQWINRDPRILPCEHTFCFECVKTVYETNSRLNCPLCKRNCVLEKNDINNLKKNTIPYYLQETIENQNQVKIH